MVDEIIFNGASGAYSIRSTELAYKTIVLVTRNDIVFNKTDSTPGNLEFRYDVTIGAIYFENPFTVSVIDAGSHDVTVYEKVSVIYKL